MSIYKLKRLREIRYTDDTEHLTGLSHDLEHTTEFRELCLELAEEAVEREIEATVIDQRIKELQERKTRILNGAEMIRNVILQGMVIRNEPSIVSPTLTLVRSEIAPDVIIADESAIPTRFFIQQPPKLDKKSIREAALKHGEVIDGVTVGDGKISLTIRRK